MPRSSAAFRAHWLRLRAVAHPTEEPDRVREAVRQAAGLEPEALEPLLTATPLATHHGGRMVVLEAEIRRAQQIRDALAHILGHGLRTRLLAELEARLDEGVLYFRLDKQEAYLGRLVPVAGDDAVQVRLKPMVHPATRENAVAALRTLLRGDD